MLVKKKIGSRSISEREACKMKKRSWKKAVKRTDKLVSAALRKEENFTEMNPESEIFYFSLSGMVMPLHCAG